ncbi:MAG: CBU_0592 family membrane protein [Sporichthyaceae bacterium]
MDQIVQLVAAVLVLGAFCANQWWGLKTDGVVFLGLNAIGTAVLAVLAGQGRDWGFLLLEGVWAIVSTVGLVRALSRRRAPV